MIVISVLGERTYMNDIFKESLWGLNHHHVMVNFHNALEDSVVYFHTEAVLQSVLYKDSLKCFPF